MTAPYRIERLAKQNRKTFDCGVDRLNRYLKQQASQDERRNVAACYLLIEQATDRVAGFYTLSAGSVLLADLPPEKAKKLPRYPTVPVGRIGRLAVDEDFKGQKLGGVLLVDAISRSSNSELGIYAMVVDAKDEDAVRFYEHHGFIAFGSAPQVLFLPLSEAVKRLLP